MKQKELTFINGVKIFNPSIFSNKRFVSELFVGKVVDELFKKKDIKKAIRNAYFCVFQNISELYGDLNNVRCMYRMLHDETMISLDRDYNASFKKDTLFVLPKNTFINAENDDIVYSTQVESFGDYHSKFDKELFSVRKKYFKTDIYEKEDFLNPSKTEDSAFNIKERNETLLTLQSKVEMIDFSKIEECYLALSEEDKKDDKKVVKAFMDALSFSSVTFSKLLEHYLPYTVFENTIESLDEYADDDTTTYHSYGYGNNENFIMSGINEANGKKFMYLRTKAFFNMLPSMYGNVIDVEANFTSIAYAATTKDNPFFAGDMFLTFNAKRNPDKMRILDYIYQKNTKLVEQEIGIKRDFIKIYLTTFENLNVRSFSELAKVLINRKAKIKSFDKYFTLEGVCESFDDGFNDTLKLMRYYDNELEKVVNDKNYVSKGIAYLNGGVKSFLVSQLYNSENSKGFFEGASYWISYALEKEELRSFLKVANELAFDKEDLSILPENIAEIVNLNRAKNTFVEWTCDSLRLFKNTIFNNRFNMDDFCFTGACFLDLVNNFYSYMFVIDIDNLKNYNTQYKMRRKFSILNDFKKYYTKIYFANNRKEKYIMSYNHEHDGIVELTVVAKEEKELYQIVTNAIKEKFKRLYYVFNNVYLDDSRINIELLTSASYTNEW